jgi:hypothetical protein
MDMGRDGGGASEAIFFYFWTPWSIGITETLTLTGVGQSIK